LTKGHLIRLLTLAAAGAAACAAYFLPIDENAVSHMWGLVVTLVLSLGVAPLTNLAASEWLEQNAYPDDFGPLLRHSSEKVGPLLTGVFETVLFYASFVNDAWALVAGWLVFKSASKWAAWQHISKLPDSLPDKKTQATDRAASSSTEQSYIVVRWYLASRLFTSFVFNTLANLLVAIGGIVVPLLFAHRLHAP
jgi:hypothetical protein